MKKVLYISGSMGLGHVIRDIAIVKQMLRIDSELQITWLANGVAADEIRRIGGTLHPRWQEYGNLNVSAQNVIKGYSLNLSDWLRNADPEFRKNLSLFSEIVAEQYYDLIVGDETYFIWKNLKDVSLARSTQFVMIYDFVPHGYLTFGVRLHNLLTGTRVWWPDDPKRLRNPNNHILFIGEISDIPDEKYGFLLPNKRRFAEKHYVIVGHVLVFKPSAIPSRKELRNKHGYRDDPLVICAVGGAGVGKLLLELCFTAYHHLSEAMPSLQMVLVHGPLLEPGTGMQTNGITTKRYVPNLYEHFAASDLVITQGGGTSTIELTALKVPFIYFPLEDHFEQQIHVSERIERHRAGKRMSYSSTDSKLLAETIMSQIGKPVEYVDINTDGARKAAEYLCSLI